MDDLISRQTAIDAVNKALDRETLLYRFVRKVAIDAIKLLPSAQPEQKKGKWIVTGTFDDFLKCSCCGYKTPWNQDVFNFCPHCGSKMEGEG